MKFWEGLAQLTLKKWEVLKQPREPLAAAWSGQSDNAWDQDTLRFQRRRSTSSCINYSSVSAVVHLALRFQVVSATKYNIGTK